MVTVQPNSNLTWYNTGPFHHMLYPYYLLLDSIVSIADSLLDLRQISNPFVNYSEHFIVNVFQFFLGTILSLFYLMTAKNNLVTSPLLLRYDSSKPTTFKTDWSTGDIEYILMKTDDVSQSLAVIQLLEDIGECTFDLSFDGPRLWPVLFGSRSNQPFEIHYHSFVGEVACGRWAISYFFGNIYKRKVLLDLRLYRSEGNLIVY